MLFRFVGPVGDRGGSSPVGGTGGGARDVMGGSGGGERASESVTLLLERTSPGVSSSDSDPSLSGASAGGGAGTGRAASVSTTRS